MRPPEHQPFYCEENVWRLAGREDLLTGPAEVVFISNEHRQVACWHQRAAPPDEPIVWDYHVVLAEHADGWRVWDLDSRLGYPLPAALWLAATFAPEGHTPDAVLAPYRPRFRVAPAVLFRASFATDRSHMRAPEGAWHHPPPPWDPPGAPAMNLMRWVDTRDASWHGDLLDLAALARRWDLAR